MTRSVLTGLLASALAIAAIALPAAAQAPADDLQRFEYTKLVMGVEARITLCAASEPAARAAAAAGFRRMEALDRVLSDYKRDSEVNTLSAIGADGPTIVSEDLHEALRRSLAMAEVSGGAFDITIGPLVRLWREARREGRLPDETAVAEARALVGWEQVAIEGPRAVRLAQRGMKLDFGGIGKGLAAQAAVEAIAAAGAPVCLVDLGGDIAAGEAPPGTAGWRVELHPGRGDDVPVALAGWSAATSGDTEQFVEIGWVRYSHIVDPRTGLGLTNRVSVVALAREGAVADALASAVSVFGPEEGLALVERLPEAEALVRQTSGANGEVREWRSSGFPRDAERQVAHNRPPAGFEPLFNGQDLAGWKGFAGDAPLRWALADDELEQAQVAADERMRAHWSVADGELRFDGAPDPEGQSLVSARQFGDFELICDWKIGPGGDSGIYLRGTPQVQIWDDPAGSGGLYNNQKHPSAPRVVADGPLREWNRFLIRMVGERVTVWLNGRLVVDDVPLENYWSREAPLPTRGEIELQAHGTPLWFRNIFVRELDAPGAGGGASGAQP
jgi:thiamine biosynthesis lipoprotein